MDGAPLAFAVAFGVVFLAELGDKTQLLVAVQATRARAARVLAEAVLAFGLLTIAAVAAGSWLGRWIPPLAAAVASGVLFVAFGVAAILRRDADAGEGRPATGTTFLLVLVGELGDKTQLATAALAATQGHPFAVGLGAWLGLAASSVLAVLAGSWLQGRLTPRRTALLAGTLFLAVGVATLAWALVPLAG